MRRLAKAMALAAVLFLPGAAHAVSVGLDLGGGYWFGDGGRGRADFHVRVDWRLGRYVSFGLRPGVLFHFGGPPFEVGLPVDAVFRFHIPHVYFDVLGGLAILFANPSPFRPNVAVGFGVPFARHWSIGGEAGWMYNGAQLLLRFSYTF
ncbi:MAG: hypothetical protein AB1938_33030 [Myxococcota bacterium]